MSQRTCDLFTFKPMLSGDTDIQLTAPKEFNIKSNRLYFSICHNSKLRNEPSRLSVLKEVIHWFRIYHMQNDRKAFMPVTIHVYECGARTELLFSSNLFKLISLILNLLPYRILKYKRFKRFFGF